MGSRNGRKRERGNVMPSEFYGLEVWQIAHKLTIELYKLTAHFPKEERFELVSQIRRAKK